MTDSDRDMVDLDVFFDAARRETTVLPGDLERRIVADATRVQHEWQIPAAAPRPGRWRQLYDMLGGWPAIGGLATACAAGVWLGFSPPATLPDPAQYLVSDTMFLDEDSLVIAMAEEG
ncbi:hypothetical protein AB9K34_20290 [Sedimentitalea sp. XS_ASV28]|uniref:hypothetical protein n=1 Tax=Sedimentitalea sp. XS_ASV28 TaxID=3241296 RepID=UPI00351479EA